MYIDDKNPTPGVSELSDQQALEHEDSLEPRDDESRITSLVRNVVYRTEGKDSDRSSIEISLVVR